MISIKLSPEARANIKKLQNLPDKLKRALMLSVDQGALEIMNKSKELAPYKTGTLRRSITKSILPGSGGLSQRIGSNLVYAAIQEFGGLAGRGHSSRIPAKRYFRRAIEQKQGKIKQIFDRNLKNAVK